MFARIYTLYKAIRAARRIATDRDQHRQPAAAKIRRRGLDGLNTETTSTEDNQTKRDNQQTKRNQRRAARRSLCALCNYRQPADETNTKRTKNEHQQTSRRAARNHRRNQQNEHQHRTNNNRRNKPLTSFNKTFSQIICTDQKKVITLQPVSRQSGRNNRNEHRELETSARRATTETAARF